MGNVFITGENFEHTQYIDEEIWSGLSNIVDISAGFGQSVFLKEDGSVVTMGFDDENKISETKFWKNLKTK